MQTPWLGWLSVVLVASTLHCTGSTTCESCVAGELTGLAVETLSTQPVGACVPVQISPEGQERYSERTKLVLGGDIGWFADATCSLRITSVSADNGSRGAIAFVGSRTAANYHATVEASPRGASFDVETIAPPTSTATSLAITGARYSDTQSCAPQWVQAIDANGKPVSLPVPLEVTLAGPRGASFYTDASCSNAAESVSIATGTSGRNFYVYYALPSEDALIARAPGVTEGSAAIEVLGETQELLAFTSPDEAITAGAGDCVALGVGVVDATGVALAVQRTLELTASDGASLFSDAACASGVSELTISGTAAATFYARADRVGSYAIAVGGTGYASISRTIDITPGPAAKLVVSARNRMAVDGCYGASVFVTDAFDNSPTGSASHVVTLGADTPLATYQDAACSVAAPSVTTIGGAATTFFVSGSTTASGVKVTASSSGLTVGRQTIEVVPGASKLSVSNVNAQAGACVAVTVTALDATGTRADVIANETVSITTSDARLGLYANADCSIATGSVVIAPLSTETVVYVRSTSPATYTVNASGSSLAAAPASTTQIKAGNATSLIASAAALSNVRGCTAVTLTFEDAYDNPTSLESARALGLASNGSGSFYSDAACANAATSVAAAIGQVTAKAYYKATVAEVATLTISGTGLASATVTVESDYLIARVHSDAPGRSVYRAAVVDPTNPARVYATFTDGSNWVTTNAGASWSRLCDTPSGSSSDVVSLTMSAAADHSVYMTTSLALYRVQATNVSGACPVLNTGLGTWSPYNARSAPPITVDATGALWLWMRNAATSTARLYVSTDSGASWSTRTSDSNNAYWVTIAVNPNNAQQVLTLRYFPSNDGTYRSVDGGVNFTKVTTSAPSTNDVVRFDPAHNGYVYTYSRFSADAGATWATSTSNLGTYWALDTSGAVYRIASSGTSTTIQKAPDARTPTFTPLTVIDDTYVSATASLSVSKNGQGIVLTTRGHCWITNDGGATFSRLTPPEAVQPAALVAAVNELVAYAIDLSWNVYATADGGLTWTTNETSIVSTKPPLIHTSETAPSTVYVRPEGYNATLDRTLLVTQDAFATSNVYSNGAYNWQTIGAVSLTDPNVFYELGNNLYRTLDGGATSTSATTAVSYTYRGGMVGAVDPSDSDFVLFAGAYDTGNGLYRYDNASNTVSDWTGRVGFAPIALEQYISASGGVVLRVASASGELATSLDFGQTFGTKGATATHGGNCAYTRLLASSTASHDDVATTCYNATNFAYSRNGGVSWATSTTISGCSIHQLSVVSNGVIVACTQGSSKLVPF